MCNQVQVLHHHLHRHLDDWLLGFLNVHLQQMLLACKTFLTMSQLALVRKAVVELNSCTHSQSWSETAHGLLLAHDFAALFGHLLAPLRPG